MDTKPWFKSITVLSALAFSIIGALENQNVIPVGASQSIMDLVQQILVVTGVFGLRRAIG